MRDQHPGMEKWWNQEPLIKGSICGVIKQSVIEELESRACSGYIKPFPFQLTDINQEIWSCQEIMILY